MHTVAVVDDDSGLRETVAKALRLSLDEKGWTVLEAAPLQDPTEYPLWIDENDVQALIVDWRLNQKHEPDSDPVDYEAPMLIEQARKGNPFLPVFVVTAYGQDPDVREGEHIADQLMDRGDLLDRPDVAAERILRAAERHSEAQQQKLARLSELAQRAAVDVLDNEERVELEALREEFHLELATSSTLTDTTLLEEAETFRKRVESLIAKIQQALDEESEQ